MLRMLKPSVNGKNSPTRRRAEACWSQKFLGCLNHRCFKTQEFHRITRVFYSTFYSTWGGNDVRCFPRAETVAAQRIQNCWKPHVLRVLVRQSHVLCKALHELRFPHDLGYFPPVPRDLLSRRLGAITDTAEGACEVNDLSKHMLFLQADIEHAWKYTSVLGPACMTFTYNNAR